MPSQYLELDEAALFGVPSATRGQIIQASALIDAYLKRPEGLIYDVDTQGNPCRMVAPNPVATFTLLNDIGPGQSVPVNLSGPTGVLQVGDVLVLDIGSSLSVDDTQTQADDGGITMDGSSSVYTGLTVDASVTVDDSTITVDGQGAVSGVEACVVQTTTNPPSPSVSITFANVLNAHAKGATAQLGLTIDEQRYMPASRPLTRLSRTPTMNVLSGVGRYGYGRRGDGADYNMEQFNLLAAVSKFGGPPVWELFQNTYPSGWDPQTGQIWVPAGIMLAYYSEVKIRYIAGFPASALPIEIKIATAAVIHAAQTASGFGGAVKSLKAGGSAVELFSSSIISDDVKALINSYSARRYV